VQWCSVQSNRNACTSAEEERDTRATSRVPAAKNNTISRCTASTPTATATATASVADAFALCGVPLAGPATKLREAELVVGIINAGALSAIPILIVCATPRDTVRIE